MKEQFVPTSSVHSYSTRFRENGSFSLPKVKSFGKQSFVYQGWIIWNELSNNIKQIHGFQTFQTAAKSHFFFRFELELSLAFDIIGNPCSIRNTRDNPSMSLVPDREPERHSHLAVSFVHLGVTHGRSLAKWSFRTQVISYPSHFVLFWSFRTHFYFQVGHLVPSLIPTFYFFFLETRFGHFVPSFYCFVPRLFRTRSHFAPILVISYPGHFVPISRLGTT